jgi:hypothetical protein
VPSEAYLRAADRDRLALERAELYVVAAAVDEVGPATGYGPQAVLWLRGPWGEGERVLSLRLNGYRRRQVVSLRDALLRSDSVGPFLLARRPTDAGHEAWALIPADVGEQLPLDQGPAA